MSNATSFEESPSYNLNPSDEYELNLFLTYLADHITDLELKKLKYLIAGRGGTGKAALERIEDPFDYFEHLRQKRLLSSDNLCALQAFIWHLGRKDLYEKFIEFGRRLKKTLYFYAPKETPENGYKYVKFHVEGKVDGLQVEIVRSEVARLLGVPPNFVVVAGIEASNSLLITFMIPDGCEMVLLSLTKEEKIALSRVCVDQFTFNGRTVLIKDDVLDVEENEEILAMRKVLEKEQRMQTELDSCHSELTLCKKKIKNLQEDFRVHKSFDAQAFAYMETARILYNILLLQQLRKEKLVPTLKRNSCFRYLSVLLRRTRSLGYDTKLIDELIQTNGLIVRYDISMAYTMQINQLKMELQMANLKMVHLSYLNQRLAFLLGQDTKDIGEKLNSIEFLEYCAMQNIIPVLQVTTSGLLLDDATVRGILGEITKELTEDDRAQLMKTVSLSKMEAEKYKKAPDILLELIMNRYVQPGHDFDIDKFVYHHLELAKRPDLKQKYDNITTRLIAEKQHSSSSGKSSQSFADAESHTQAKSKPSTKKMQRSRHESEKDTLADISSRMQKLENVIEKALKVSSGPFQPRNVYFDEEAMRMAAKTFLSKKYASDTDNRNIHKFSN